MLLQGLHWVYGIRRRGGNKEINRVKERKKEHRNDNYSMVLGILGHQLTKWVVHWSVLFDPSFVSLCSRLESLGTSTAELPDGELCRRWLAGLCSVLKSHLTETQHWGDQVSPPAARLAPEEGLYVHTSYNMAFSTLLPLLITGWTVLQITHYSLPGHRGK